jgi:tetratricopeptide (TPR) repeat protein
LTTLPDSITALRARCILRLKTGSLTVAEADCRRAVELAPRAERAAYLISLAGAQAIAGDLNGALASLDEAALERPRTVHEPRASVLLGLKRFDEAERAAKAAVESFPEMPGPYDVLGQTLLNQERYEQAEAALNEALVRDPVYENAHLNLVVVLGHQKRWPEAVAAARTAVTLSPRSGAAHFCLGRALWSLVLAGQSGEAIYSTIVEAETELKTATVLDPGNPAPKELLQVMSQRMLSVLGTIRRNDRTVIAPRDSRATR